MEGAGGSGTSGDGGAAARRGLRHDCGDVAVFSCCEGRKRPKKSRRKGKKKETNQVHPDYQCDHCDSHKRIVGVRYCCQECSDYDLCEACFQHALEFHPHHHYLAYDPPQYDVFGMLKEGEGKPVEAKEEGSQEEGSGSGQAGQSTNQPSQPNQSNQSTNQSTNQSNQSIQSSNQSNQSTNQPTSQPSQSNQPTSQPSQSNQPNQSNQSSQPNQSSSINQPSTNPPAEPNEADTWTVVGDKRRRHHSQSVSGIDDASRRLNSRTKPPKQTSEKTTKNRNTKMTYKQAIQKSLPKQTNKEPLPIVSTGTNTEAKTEPSKENPPAEKAEAPLDLSIDKLFPPSFSIDYSLPFHDEPKYDLGYYDYPPENGYGMPYREDWWPKTHYGQWREREMGLERNSYLQDPGLSPFIDYGTLPTYSSEELQVEEKRRSEV